MNTKIERRYRVKEDGSKRPLGIAALEDKIVQQAIRTVLNQIYEVDFVDFSYGFRENRSQHDALDALYVGITSKKINWILDADIKGFFDNLNHDMLMRFLEIRIGDKRILRVIRKWLKTGYIEDGKRIRQEKGTPQGAVISPLLANIFLHYVLDIWASWWRKSKAQGDMIIVRYADDFVVGFQYYREAVSFLSELKKRRHHSIKETGDWLASVIVGHVNYYGVPGNMDRVWEFLKQCEREWFKTLRRRSQKARKLKWSDVREKFNDLIPRPNVAHPYPDERFWRQRLEVGAG